MKIILAVLSLGICMSVSSAAVNKDHPLLSGIPGYKFDQDVQIVEFGTMEKGSFGSFVCNAGKPCDDTVPGFKGGKLVAEGKVTKIVYRNDKAPIGPLAIQRTTRRQSHHWVDAKSLVLTFLLKARTYFL
jgi:hypothetical protein